MQPSNRSGATSTRRSEPPRILVAEDDHALRELIAEAFEDANLDVVECENGLQFITSIEVQGARSFAALVSDIRMPSITGLEALAWVREHAPALPCVIITAFGDRETHTEAKRLGAAAVLDKPFDIDDLVTIIRELVSC